MVGKPLARCGCGSLSFVTPRAIKHFFVTFHSPDDYRTEDCPAKGLISGWNRGGDCAIAFRSHSPNISVVNDFVQDVLSGLTVAGIGAAGTAIVRFFESLSKKA